MTRCPVIIKIFTRSGEHRLFYGHASSAELDFNTPQPTEAGAKPAGALRSSHGSLSEYNADLKQLHWQGDYQGH